MLYVFYDDIFPYLHVCYLVTCQVEIDKMSIKPINIQIKPNVSNGNNLGSTGTTSRAHLECQMML